MRVAISQIISLERLYRKETDNDKWSNLIIDEKELIRDNQQESFQIKDWFN